MAEDKELLQDEHEDEVLEEVVVMHDEHGHEVYFYEESSVEYKGQRYALMVQIDADEVDAAEDGEGDAQDDACGCGHDHAHEHAEAHEDECGCGCGHDHDGDDDMEDMVAFIAKVEEHDGKTEYVAPADEDFEAVKALFEALADELDEEEE